MQIRCTTIIIYVFLILLNIFSKGYGTIVCRPDVALPVRVPVKCILMLELVTVIDSMCVAVH